MDNLDDVLQQQLEAVESGVPLEKVLAGLPSEASDLAALITLATSARNMTHPRLRGEAVRAQQRKLVDAVHARRSRSKLWPWFGNLRLSYAMAGGFALLLLVAAVAIGLNMVFSGVTSVQAASLANINGLVEVSTAADGSNWHFVSAGEAIHQGQRIHTYAGSSVTLNFYEGSSTVIGPDTDLVLTTLGGGTGNALQVLMTQDSGMTNHSVVPLRGNGSFFQVDTPSGMAIVHGTNFNVDVSTSGLVLFAVTHGKVQVKNASSEVYLASGQATSALDSQALEPPAYQFTLRGVVQDITGDTWQVNDVQFTVNAETDILGEIQEGNPVSVKGRIVDGKWIADRIEPYSKGQQKSNFTGVIDSMTQEVPGIWSISGHDVKVDPNTDLASGLQVGSAVEVSFVVLPDSGGWLATEIDSLEAQNPTSTPTATETATFTPTFTETPSLESITSGDTDTPTPTATFTPTATVIPKNEDSRCLNRTELQPDALRLQARYGVSYNEIMDWFCKGFGFGEIDLAYELSLSSGKPVSEIFSMRVSGMSWGEIKQELEAIPKVKTPAPTKTKKPQVPTPKPSKTPRK